MDLQHSAIYLLIFMVGMNAFATILTQVGITVNLQPGMQGITNIDINGTVLSYKPDPLSYLDNFFFSARSVFNTVGSLVIWGAPALFVSLGVPNFIVVPIFGIWTLMWFIVVILYWIGGRQV
jgi:hypothetical protein